MFLAHGVLIEISLANSEVLSIQVNALNSICRPLTLTLHDFNESEILKIIYRLEESKLMVISFCINLIPKLGMMMMLVQGLR
jgi:hypothetical protein